MIVVVIVWKFALGCGSKHHFQSHSFRGVCLIDAPLATPHAWNAMACPQKENILQWVHFQLPVLVKSRKNLLNEPGHVAIDGVFDHSICFIPKTAHVSKHNDKFWKHCFKSRKNKFSEKTLEVPLDTPNTVKQHNNHNLFESTCLGTKTRSPNASWNWHAPSRFSKARPLIVTANVCPFSKKKKKQQNLTGHVYGAAFWPTSRQSFSGADSGALSGTHTGHVWKIRGTVQKMRGHAPKIKGHVFGN